ncbi:YgiQ family radical SAM protein [Clostridium grantii]|uniref:Uncharacterized radical SAM protein YgiQ n=1 Tax=Clostridium grantii DSM 8605 TaxID=1121316 RepID=A0A1M5X4Z6_9CLOT|nr:YgiQ family radical SAM protein [Clostridium grantii]SHH94866.1 uncharacterized radical SAM protein YgiQ [Clostridium grantii DSM 8605]
MLKNNFLPINKEDMIERGWDELDFIMVTADAYVDHHSFGTAIISRVLEAEGYKVGIIAQPKWDSTDDFKKLGAPRLGFLVNGGNMDPMVNHYTVSKRLRTTDAYSPGGEMGLRPDRSTIVYCNKIREAFKNATIIIGGLEASLRRFAHYDYWSDKVRKSILFDSGADLLIFGMGERPVVEIAKNLEDGLEAKYIRHIPGTCYIADSKDEIYDYMEIPSYKEVSTDKVKYAEAARIQYKEQDPIRGNVLVQEHNGKYVVQNLPIFPLSRKELDKVYDLPYTKNYHPSYEAAGGIPAITEVKFSLVSSRGCFGNCSFCAITFHQGRIVQSRSEESIVKEAEEMVNFEDFKGYIHDLGGPTADFRQPSCKKQLKEGTCKNKQCLFPNPCANLDVDHMEYLNILRKLRKIPKVKKVFVRSGLRYDYMMADKDNTFFKELIEHHVSGQLKVAPEHVSSDVLKYMGKPSGKTYDNFTKKFEKFTERAGKKQYIIPYLMSSHPGSTLASAIELAEYLRDISYQPEQVQDFYPTPGSLSTAMFYTGLDPLTMKEVYIPRTKNEKAMQRALLQFRNPKKYDIVRAALVEANREDLIGFGPKCLIKPKEKKVDFERNHPRSKKPSTSSTKTNSKNTSNKNSKNSDFDITNEDLLYAERKSSKSKKSTKSKSNKSFSKDSSKPTSKAKKSNSKNNSKPSGKSSYGKNPAGKKNTRAVPTRKGK